MIFAAAIAYLGNRAYRSVSKKEAGCGKGCGCAADSATKTVAVKEKL